MNTALWADLASRYVLWVRQNGMRWIWKHEEITVFAVVALFFLVSL